MFQKTIIARKYEGYGGDSKYYDSTKQGGGGDTYDRYERYDRYDNPSMSKYRSDNDVKDKPKDKEVPQETFI